MIMIVKTPGSQMGSPAAAGEGAVGGGRGESGERREVQSRSSLTSTAPKARSGSREVATPDEAPRIVKGGMTLRSADCGALAAGLGLEPSIRATAEAGAAAGPSIGHSCNPNFLKFLTR